MYLVVEVVVGVVAGVVQILVVVEAKAVEEGAAVV